MAWAAYLIPKALEHHEAGARSRTVDKFSDTMRVLARREPVDRRTTQLVTSRKPTAGSAGSAAPAGVAPAAPAVPAAEAPQEREPVPEVEQTGFFAAQTFVRRSSASRAARRRRRVLGGILVLVAMVAALAAGQVVSWWWLAAPVVLLVAWLVACRVMVTGERAARSRPVRRITDPAEPDLDDATRTDGPEDGVHDGHQDGLHEGLHDNTAEVPVVRAEVAEPIASGDGWELVPVTLPTYVSKPAARRAVSTIDLDSTGVWTSGHTAADSALAQQADAVRAAGSSAGAAGAQAQPRRASGA